MQKLNYDCFVGEISLPSELAAAPGSDGAFWEISDGLEVSLNDIEIPKGALGHPTRNWLRIEQGVLGECHPGGRFALDFIDWRLPADELEPRLVPGDFVHAVWTDFHRVAHEYVSNHFDHYRYWDHRAMTHNGRDWPRSYSESYLRSWLEEVDTVLRVVRGEEQVPTMAEWDARAMQLEGRLS